MKSVLTDNLARFCKAHDWTTYSLNKVFGMSNKTASRLLGEADSQNPTLKSIEFLAEKLDIPYWQIFFPDCPSARLGDKEIEGAIRQLLSLPDDMRERIARMINEQSELDRLRKENH